MEVSMYEKTYNCVKVAMRATEHVDEVVELLKKNAPTSLTCQEIGTTLWGDRYTYSSAGDIFQQRRDNYFYRSCISTLGKILAHLTDKGFVKRTVVETKEPVVNALGDIVTRTKWVKGKEAPYYIDVWDKDGNHYQMPNPKWSHVEGHYEEVPIYKTIATYTWVGEI